MIRRLLCSLGFADPAMPLVVRSSQWPAVRRKHLRLWPTCAACGTCDGVEVHHIVPVHVDKSKELMDWNLLSLCKAHHLLVGHLGSWHSWNESARTDAAWWLEKVQRRP